MSTWCDSRVKILFGCVLSGLLLGLSQPLFMPDIYLEVWRYQYWLGALAFVGYIPLFWMIAHRDLKSTFVIAVITLTVHYTIALYWIYVALHVHGHIEPFFAALITLVLPIVVAMMGATFLTVGRFLSLRFNCSFFWVAPFALCAAEYFRNFYLFGGFPWGHVGYSIGRIDQFLQLASLVGVYGLVFFVALVNSLICLAWSTGTRRRFYYQCAAALLVLLSFFYGAARLRANDHEFAPSMRVALLQGNIPQEMKSASRLHAKDILDIYADLTSKAKDAGAQLVVWPESSYPWMMDEHVKTWSLAEKDRVACIVGATAYAEKENGSGYHVRNSAFLVTEDGDVVKRYDKTHLVPFGEYVPWPMTNIVDKVVPGLGAYLPGTNITPVALEYGLGKTVMVGTTVCYEGIFPEISRAYAKKGALLLINLTNDAWYGYSSAPYQHLLMYKLRSAETGLPYLRATNSGITAWVDPYGRIKERLGLFQRGMVLADVPLMKKTTVYVAIGDIVPIFSLILLMIGFVASVLPIHLYFRRRQWWKLALVFGLSAICLGAHIYYGDVRFLADESARTKELLVFLFSLLLMIGILSETKRSRAILFLCSTMIVAISLILSIIESLHFLFGLAFGLLIYLLAFRIKESAKPTNK